MTQVLHEKGKFYLDGIEIINPEVLPNVYYKDNKIHIDGVDVGESWNLPDGIEWEKEQYCGKYDLKATTCYNCAGDCYDPKYVIRLKLMSPEKKITYEKLLEVKEAIGERGTGELKFIENTMLPDNVVVVSSKMYKSLKESVK